MSDPLLQVDHLRVYFPILGGVLRRQTGEVRAVDDVSFTVGAGETVGLVGESGSGKTTVGRAIIKLVKPTSGRVLWEGTDTVPMDESGFRPLRKKITEALKKNLAEIDSLYRSRIAEKEILMKPQIAEARRAGDDTATVELERRLADDLRKLREECDSEKEKIRNLK